MSESASDQDAVRLPTAGGMKRSSWRRMLPREHGAYAQLVLPLGAALAASRPNVAGASFAIAAAAAFVAHEPALVLLGRRGARARREGASIAWRWLACALAGAVALGGAALVLSPASRMAVSLPGALGALAAVLLWFRHERTLPGELVVCGALTCSALPTALAGGIEWHNALALCGVFWTAFAISTVEVRSIAGNPPTSSARIGVWSAALGSMVVVAVARPLLAAAALPVIAVVVVSVVCRFTAKRLRELGWVLAAASLVMTVSVITELRADARRASAETGPAPHRLQLGPQVVTNRRLYERNRHLHVARAGEPRGSSGRITARAA